MLEQAAGQDDAQRSVRERERTDVAEGCRPAQAGPGVVLADRADRVGRVVERDEAVRTLEPDPDEEPP